MSGRACRAGRSMGAPAAEPGGPRSGALGENTLYDARWQFRWRKARGAVREARYPQGMASQAIFFQCYHALPSPPRTTPWRLSGSFLVQTCKLDLNLTSAPGVHVFVP